MKEVNHHALQHAVSSGDGTIVDILRRRARTHADRRCYTFLRNGEEEEATLSFYQLDLQARAVAANLQALGAKGKRVLLSFPPGLGFIVAFCGCLYAGAVAVPVTPPRRNHRDDRIKRIIADADISLVMTSATLVEDIRFHLVNQAGLTDVRVLVAEYSDAEAELLAQAWVSAALEDDTYAFLQYTSGSTGSPKGVIVSHGNLVHNQRMVRSAFGHDEHTVFAGWLPLYHDMGLIGNVLQPMYLGIHCVLMSPVAFTQMPIRWLQMISRYKATTSGAPNFAYDLCVRKIIVQQCKGLDLSSWSVAFNGAEPVRANTMDLFSETFEPYGFQRNAFYPCYGMAETTLFLSGGVVHTGPTVRTIEKQALEQNRALILHDDSDINPTMERSIVACGRTWHDQCVRVVDPETCMPCDDGCVGEIWTMGGSVAKGYWNNAAQTRETFQAHLADGTGPFLRTGDLGFMHDGDLFVTGRLKDIIIIQGRNHYPHDIEATVAESHPSFRPGNGAAFTIDVKGEERLAIVQEIERSWTRSADSRELTQIIREAVAKRHGLYAHTVALIRAATIPKTTSDKIRRKLCRSMLLDGQCALIADVRLKSGDAANDARTVVVDCL